MSQPAAPRVTMVRTEADRARLALGAYVVVAWCVLIFGFGSRRWFLFDDWSLLAGTDGGSIRSVFTPHGEHLIALPAITYRLLYNVVGLNFLPYLALLVTMHAGVVGVLWVLMRRLAVRPWTAAMAAGLLALFGSGEENLQWAFQISFVGSILFGLIQLVLADEPRGLGRRDVVGATCGVLAVCSSGIGLVMLVPTAVVGTVRRGFVTAAVHVGPAAVLYVAWTLWMRPHSTPGEDRPSVGDIVRWVVEGSTGTVEALTQSWPTALALTVLVGAGLTLMWRRTVDPVRSRMLTPLVLATTGPLCFGVIAVGRWQFGTEFARSSRYLYLGAVLVLPAVAVGIDELLRRDRRLGLLAASILLVGVPGNLTRLNSSFFGTDYFAEQREALIGMAHDPLIDLAPDWIRVDPHIYNGPDLTAGWLRDARDAGRVPDPEPLDPTIANEFPVRLGIAQHDWRTPARPDPRCAAQSRPLNLDVVRGDQIQIDSDVVIRLLQDGHPVSRWLEYQRGHGSGVLSVEVPRLSIQIDALPPDTRFRACLID